MKQARGAAKTTIKMKNLKKGTTLENTYNSGAKFETAEIVRKTSQYTYEDEVREVDPFRKVSRLVYIYILISKLAPCSYFILQQGNYMFMDTESFEEVLVESKMIEDQKKWISEGMECVLIYFKGDVIEVRAPSPYIFEVVETEPNVKGNTSQGYTKPAVLSCGATISVPGFVEQGQLIKVDTEKGEYIERVK